MHFCAEQNHYPDVTFITKDKQKIALDIKSTYRKENGDVSGFTLGAFTGYFRFRDSNKNITFPYKEYSKRYSDRLTKTEFIQSTILKKFYPWLRILILLFRKNTKSPKIGPEAEIQIISALVSKLPNSKRARGPLQNWAWKSSIIFGLITWQLKWQETQS